MNTPSPWRPFRSSRPTRAGTSPDRAASGPELLDRLAGQVRRIPREGDDEPVRALGRLLELLGDATLHHEVAVGVGHRLYHRGPRKPPHVLAALLLLHLDRHRHALFGVEKRGAGGDLGLGL